jgi:death-on-curing protein
MDIRYPTLSELIYINGVVLDKPEIAAGRQKIRDVELLDAAVARPSASAFGQDAYPTLREKAAALLHSVARNHPFTDGNKRTSVIGAVFMLRVNGQTVVWKQDDALAMILRVAEGKSGVDELAAWFPLEADHLSLSPEPDATGDMRLIAQLIDEQRGLLDELKRR